MDTILVISNEPALGETLASELAGYGIEQVRAKDAAARIQKNSFHLILTDDEADTSEIHDALAGSKTPVVKLVRPVRLCDLLYTIRERLARKTTEEITLSSSYHFLPSERILYSKDGTPSISLTEKESELLRALLAGNGKSIARDALLKSIWGYSDDISTHTLETHVYRLRGKLRQADEALDIISSEEGGYRLSLA
jgi:DNA-binding response OmpR family regulator